MTALPQMTPASYFAAECATLDLPLEDVVTDTAGFIAAILALPDPVKQIRMNIALQKPYSYLCIFLMEKYRYDFVRAQTLNEEVVRGLREGGVPLLYRDIPTTK